MYNKEMMDFTNQLYDQNYKEMFSLLTKYLTVFKIQQEKTSAI